MPSPSDPAAEAALREAASEWFIRMRGPDAARSQAAFDAWLAADARHRAMYNRVSISWEQSRLIANTPMGQAWQGLPKRAPARRPIWPYALAASIAAVLMIGLLIAHGRPGPDPQLAAQQISSPTGIRSVKLGDGSIVTLDAGARVELFFGTSERRLVLTHGRARFAVASDAGRPFVVRAGDREVVATGTVFDVTCESGKISVALLRGSVDVREVGEVGPSAAPMHLSEGETLQLAFGQTTPARSTMNDAARTWPSGMVDFDGTPLREVIATANRYSTRQIVLGDKALGDLRVTGGYRVGDPAALAATLAAAFHLRVTEGPTQTLVLRR